MSWLISNVRNLLQLTVTVLNFQTDTSEQTALTHNRLVRVYTVCHLDACLYGNSYNRNDQFSDRQVWANSADPGTVSSSICILWLHYSAVKPSCINFSVITANVSGIRIFTVVKCSDNYSYFFRVSVLREIIAMWEERGEIMPWEKWLIEWLK